MAFLCHSQCFSVRLNTHLAFVSDDRIGLVLEYRKLPPTLVPIATAREAPYYCCSSVCMRVWTCVCVSLNNHQTVVSLAEESKKMSPLSALFVLAYVTGMITVL